METHRRSITKALSWRIVAVIVTWLVAWSITGSLHIGISIGVVDCFIKLIVYYAHERGWQRVHWGTLRSDVIVGKGEGI